MSTVRISNLKKNYGNFEAIKGVDLEIGDGEFIVMVGPSGCGKSTLLRTIAGLEGADAGQIFVGARDVTYEEPADRGVAMVFQNYALYPHMSVAGNMSFGLRMARMPQEVIMAAINRAAGILHISDHLDKRPSGLSGGQKQRVAIGRAITRQPEVFLFDEPLSNLDAALRTKMRVELGRLHGELNATMIYVTHDQIEAMTMADRIVVLRDGEIEQVGSPRELYNRPANRFVAGFLGSPKMNFFDARVAEVDGAQVTIDLPGLVRLERTLKGTERMDVRAGDTVVLGIRPEAIGTGDLSFALDVNLVENLGRETLVYGTPQGFTSVEADADDGDIVVQYPRQRDVERDQTVEVQCASESFYIFSVDGIALSFAQDV
ncbi:ABC transporter ATP-binding protein [uncultured Tateyamaria sp.]|uniref:ABC transporter ATP-binding protein n=1 Tax=uncultured Tateyamaria sp. TaxID=455651 RepID=UPI00261E4973|nr:sn-glycerol-3-phosphate ABC transporter ATP-binding protein UgpC [uncultured Tateyamaria sp.]